MTPCSEWIDLSFSTTRGWVVTNSFLVVGCGDGGDAFAAVEGESVLTVSRVIVGTVE
jgi:hypothetical protein